MGFFLCCSKERRKERSFFRPAQPLLSTRYSFGRGRAARLTGRCGWVRLGVAGGSRSREVLYAWGSVSSLVSDVLILSLIPQFSDKCNYSHRSSGAALAPKRCTDFNKKSTLRQCWILTSVNCKLRTIFPSPQKFPLSPDNCPLITVNWKLPTANYSQELPLSLYPLLLLSPNIERLSLLRIRF